jgi:hypothetical protein
MADARFILWSVLGLTAAGLAQLANSASPRQAPWPVLLVTSTSIAWASARCATPPPRPHDAYPARPASRPRRRGRQRTVTIEPERRFSAMPPDHSAGRVVKWGRALCDWYAAAARQPTAAASSPVWLKDHQLGETDIRSDGVGRLGIVRAGQAAARCVSAVGCGCAARRFPGRDRRRVVWPREIGGSREPARPRAGADVWRRS